MMEKIIEALKYFEGRNNISAFVTVHSDGSLELLEFWEEDILWTCASPEELIYYLLNTKYELDENGVCIKPCKANQAHAEGNGGN